MAKELRKKVDGKSKRLATLLFDLPIEDSPSSRFISVSPKRSAFWGAEETFPVRIRMTWRGVGGRVGAT